MPIRNSQEFMEALKAGLRKLGYEPSGITVVDEVETKDPSDTISIGVVMNPRRPKRKGEALKG